MRTLLYLISATLLASASSGPVCATTVAQAKIAEPAKTGFTLSGRVLNNKGTPLPGAVVAVKGASGAVTTNSAGGFLLSIEESTSVVQITCPGYQSQTLTAAPVADLVITLYPIGVAPPLGVHTEDVAGNPNLVVADVQPTYPGGVVAYREYLKQNAHYPDKAREANKSGDVFVSFVVDEVGRIIDAQVVKGIGFGLDEEALRLVRLMPWWSPGTVGGKPVKITCTLRIKFGVEQPLKSTAY